MNQLERAYQRIRARRVALGRPGDENEMRAAAEIACGMKPNPPSRPDPTGNRASGNVDRQRRRRP